MSAPRLYHFTCGHGHKGISAGGLVDPLRTEPMIGYRVAWFTTLAEPDRFATGLTSVVLDCDRMEHRYVIEPGSQARAWLFSAERMRTPPELRYSLERFGDPEHWWISDVPIVAVYDESWKQVPA